MPWSSKATLLCLASVLSAGQAQTSPPSASVPVESYAGVVARVAPAVVTVRSERRVRAPEAFPFSFSDPRLREFFGSVPRGERAPQERLQRGLGSGVIVRPDGYCLTNHHVVDGAEEIQVELSDGRRLDAKLIGSDPPSDLAVLKIDASGLPVLQLGNSDNVRVGDIALAVGNPLGVGQTVTMGIISAKNRTTGLGEGAFEDFIQTDAPINQGNSGGALVNTSGQLIGINSQILSPSGGSIGIGFAIPSNMARNVMEQLIATGHVRRGQLGVGIQPITPDLASSLGLGGTQGVLVNSVTPGSPADTAGIKQGDVIVSVNGQQVNDTNALRNRIASTAPGTDVTLTVRREGRDQTMKVRLGELTAARAGESQQRGSERGPGRLGVAVEPVPPDVAGRFKVPANQGLLIREVDPTGAAAEAGLAPGDILLEANRQPLRSVADLEKIVRAGAGRPVLLLINREGQTVFIAVRPKNAQ